MSSVERVKSICKEKKIPISKLERDLGYSNGYIGQLRKGVFPTDRLVDIANYLNVSTDYLLTGEETKKAPAPEGADAVNDLKLKVAAYWGGGDELSQEELDNLWNDAESYYKFKLEQMKKKNRSKP